jgi:hypothetical protein
MHLWNRQLLTRKDRSQQRVQDTTEAVGSSAPADDFQWPGNMAEVYHEMLEDQGRGGDIPPSMNAQYLEDRVSQYVMMGVHPPDVEFGRPTDVEVTEEQVLEVWTLERDGY